jgi:hypothetical protein
MAPISAVQMVGVISPGEVEGAGFLNNGIGSGSLTAVGIGDGHGVVAGGQVGDLLWRR